MSDLIYKLSLWQIRLTAAFLAVGAGLLGLYWRQLPPEVPFFYTHAWGSDQLASPAWLWLLPGLNLILGLGTSYLITRLKLDSVLAACWVITIIAIQTIMTLALIRIIVLML